MTFEDKIKKIKEESGIRNFNSTVNSLCEGMLFIKKLVVEMRNKPKEVKDNTEINMLNEVISENRNHIAYLYQELELLKTKEVKDEKDTTLQEWKR